jgi:hypothetical protein
MHEALRSIPSTKKKKKKKKTHHKKGLVEWLTVQALSSGTRTRKKKIVKQ